MPSTGGKLTPKQQRFVEEYLIDLNATQAAIRAGYKPKAAHQTGFENLRKPEIAAEIEKAQGKLTKRTEVTQEWIVQGLKKEAEREGEDASHSARVHAFTQLGKHLGMFTDKIAHSGIPAAPTGPTLDVSKLSTDKLDQLIGILAPLVPGPEPTPDDSPA